MKAIKAIVCSMVLCVLFSKAAMAEEVPDCRGKDAWPAAMGGVYLKNAGLIEIIDFKEIAVERLASEEIGDYLYKQVPFLRYVTEKTTFELITVNDVSSVECSMSGVEVFVVTNRKKL